MPPKPLKDPYQPLIDKLFKEKKLEIQTDHVDYVFEIIPYRASDGKIIPYRASDGKLISDRYSVTAKSGSLRPTRGVINPENLLSSRGFLLHYFVYNPLCPGPPTRLLVETGIRAFINAIYSGRAPERIRCGRSINGLNDHCIAYNLEP